MINMNHNQVNNKVSNESFKIKLVIVIMFMFNRKFCEAGLRIIGGRDALKDEFPFAVRLEEQYTYNHDSITEYAYFPLCSGAAVTPNWILTAAHCDNDNLLKITYHQLITTKPSKFVRYNSYFPKEMGELSPILEIFNHPSYADIQFKGTIPLIKYDIALYKTENVMVSYYAKFSPVEYTSFVGHEVVSLGFGITNGTLTEKHLQVMQGVLVECESEYNYHGLLCVMPRCGLDATICSGDSGGPIVHASGIIGVNSYFAGNCDEHKHELVPGEASVIIAIVSPFIDWITNIIANKIDGRLYTIF